MTRTLLDGIGSLARSIRNKTPVAMAPRQAAAALPMFGGSQRTQQMRAMASSGTLFNIVNRTSTATSQVTWHLYRKAASGKKEDRVEVTRHLAKDVWDRPNSFYTRQELVESEQQHIDLTGEGWLVVGRDPRMPTLPLELWVVRPDRIAPVQSPTDFLTGYVYTGPSGEAVPLAREDVLMIRMPNPDDPYRGMGPVQAILTNLDSERYSAEWNRNFFLNSAEPGGIIEVEKRLTDDEFAEMTTRWREQHQGVSQAHRVAVLEQGRWVDRKYTQRDMQFVELNAVGRDIIREAFGFPKFLSGSVEDVNRASADASEAMFAKYLTVPRADRFKGMLNNDFLPLFGSTAAGLEWDYDSPVPENEEAENAERDSTTKAVSILMPLGFTADSLVKAYGLPSDLVWEKPEPPAPPVIAAPAPGQPDPNAPAGTSAADPNAPAANATNQLLTLVLTSMLEDRARRADEADAGRFRTDWP